ncbi:MAG TPA: hypothetical protein VFJ13_12135 [Paracoccaceae bacterium]|nr:hypothetical protein [Paracoccaceae bacterium]
MEDLFDRAFYADIVNKEYATQLSKRLDVATLNQSIPRTLVAVEEALRKAPLKSGSFGHFRPARYFQEHINKLKGDISEATKDRFEEVFRKLNAILDG